MKAFQAYSGGNTATAPTPRKAAEKFFSDFPKKRKCDVVEGEADGNFFIVTCNLRRENRAPKRFNGVTRKSVATLPDEQ